MSDEAAVAKLAIHPLVINLTNRRTSHGPDTHSWTTDVSKASGPAQVATRSTALHCTLGWTREYEDL